MKRNKQIKKDNVEGMPFMYPEPRIIDNNQVVDHLSIEMVIKPISPLNNLPTKLEVILEGKTVNEINQIICDLRDILQVARF